ncbi:thioredoxin, partial [bacterium]|nr:thioredoxin [bacterium]
MKRFLLGTIWGILLVGNSAIAADVLLAFTAEWCGPCQQFKADYMADKNLVAGYETEIINVDKAKELARDFDVKSYPTFIVIKVEDDGTWRKDNIVKRKSGYDSPKKFKKWLE